MPRLEVRCSVGEKELWVALAGREGLSLSQWVRSRLSVVDPPVVERVGERPTADVVGMVVDEESGAIRRASPVASVLARRFGS